MRSQGLHILFLILVLEAGAQSFLKRNSIISGNISPKSIVHSGNGLFFAQNMIYQHSVTVYDRNHRLVKTIPDRIRLGDFLVANKTGYYSGGPVEAAFTPDGKFAWVSNYRMSGIGYSKPSMDTCVTGAPCEKSFLYKISTDSLAVVQVAEVGCVPKFLAVSPNGKLLVVSNWCSGSVSILDASTGVLIQEVPVGPYPRGISIDSSSSMAYISLMGSHCLVVIDLINQKVKRQFSLGAAPRHSCLASDNSTIFLSLNTSHRVVQLDLEKGAILRSLDTGKNPRSMVLSKDGKRLYVANYKSNTVTKINTDSFTVMETVAAPFSPIGITFDDITREVWIAGYSGEIWVYKDWEPVREETLWSFYKSKLKPKVESTSVVVPEKELSQEYTIVVGSYSSAAPAILTIDNLKQMGYEAALLENGDKFRVGIGSYSREKAVKELSVIRQRITRDAWLLKVLE